jgi:thiamine biosynthesis protein ThiI
VISRAAALPVLRPLVGADKTEITAWARAIGTYELSKGVGEYCALVPRKPATQAKLSAVLFEESRLPADPLATPLASRSVFDLRSLEETAFDDAALAVERLPDDAVLIDLRPLEKYRSGHHPSALSLPLEQAAAAWPSFDRGRRYVLCCEFGLLSAQLAGHMRREGFLAHHFRGGQKALMRGVTPA